jgi:serine/threonine protein kinase
MSPEQARGQTPTPASDVFSLGLVFFEMLTGRRAMNQGRLINLLRALQRDELAEELASEVPAAHRSMLSAMLQSDPERRCSANDVAEALHDAVGT